jgi:hypothetical protein
MKCLPECGFQHTPDNSVILRHHMNACAVDGPLRDVESPDIVWADGEFAVVRQAEEGQQTYNNVVQFVKPVLEAEETPAEEVPVEEEPEE